MSNTSVHPLWDRLARERLIEHVRQISRFERLSGSREERSAFEYIASQLREAGIDARLRAHPAYISLPLSARITLSDGTALPCVTHSFVPSTDGVTGPMVDASSDFDETRDLHDRVALVDGLAMTSNVRRLEHLGALAQIHVNSALTYEMIPTSVWGSPASSDAHYYPSTPVVSVTSDVGKALRSRLHDGPQAVTVATETDTQWREIPLLVADVRSPVRDDFILFSGHVDSWHHGAMDNASGNAVMIEIARGLHELSHTLQRGVRFCFWSGHSHGRYAGSAWYADNEWQDLRRHCVAHVNIDSVGGAGANVLSQGIAMASTRPIGQRAITGETGLQFDGVRVGRAGDQSFVALGIPSLWMTLSEQSPSDDITAKVLGHLVGGAAKSGGLGWWWHTVEDKVEHVDPDNLHRDARIYARAIGDLAWAPLPPLDLAAEAQELARLIDGLVGNTEAFDLSATRRLARQTATACAELANLVENAAPRNLASQKLVEAMSRHALREIIQLNYSAAGPYDQDPAEGVPPVPLLAALARLADQLDDDEEQRLRIQLTRGRNRVNERLELAHNYVLAAINALGSEND